MEKKVVVYTGIQTESLLKYEACLSSFNDYSDMQKFVKGYIELLPIPIVINGEHYDVFINEEGKLTEGLLPAIVLLNNGEIHDVTMGDFFVSKSNEEGESVSLTDEEIKNIQQFVRENTHLVQYGKKDDAELLVMNF